MPDSNPYQVEILPEALTSLKRLNKPVATRIIKKIRWLAAHVETIDHVALKGEWSGYFRYRIGDYRVIYDLDREGRIVIVAVVGHRRNVYDE
jgi:mRNA interferase RelE/StbE